jgi:hypothetical protein
MDERYDAFLDHLSDAARAYICWNTPERVYGNPGEEGLAPTKTEERL